MFGHEKGSFTGAIRQQLGKFELAAGGTLFLDEVADLRYELQAKLLRAIQEGEIERVGGTHPIKTNFRLIATTNTDLGKAVKSGTFREDLFLPPERDPARSQQGDGRTRRIDADDRRERGPGDRDGVGVWPDLRREDLFALNRVYPNLIMNALQATPPRGQVVVRTRRQNGQAVIEIANAGCGIPRERLDTIFDDFVTTKRRSLGLGLAISKKVVEQLDGTIAVESQIGIGSTFTLCFPLTKARRRVSKRTQRVGAPGRGGHRARSAAPITSWAE